MRGMRIATPEDVPALTTLINDAYRVEDFSVTGGRIDEGSPNGRASND